jgi:hypothetical protein
MSRNEGDDRYRQMEKRIKERDGIKTPIILPGSADKICPDGDIAESIRRSGGRITIHTGRPYGEVDSGEEEQNIKEEQQMVKEEPENVMEQIPESQIPESLREKKRIVSKRISKYLAVLKTDEEEIDTYRCGCGSRKYSTRAKPGGTLTEPIVVEDNGGTETEEDHIVQGSNQSLRNSIKRASTGAVGGVVINLIGKGNTLTDSVLFEDGEKTVHSFVENVYKCKGDFYSLNPISEWKSPNSWNIWLLFILAAIALAVVMNSYWPILKKIYSGVMKMNKNVKIVTEIELKAEDGTKTVQPVTVKEVNEIACEDICLVIWVIVCLLCSLAVALLVAVGLITIVTSKQNKVEEQLCEPLQKIASGRSRARNRLSNKDESGLLTIVNEGEEDGLPYTVLTMPCDSTLIDDFGNVWDLVGPWKLECEDFTEFQYLGDRLPKHWSSCCSYPKVSSEYEKELGTQGDAHSWSCWYCGGLQYWRAR